MVVISKPYLLPVLVILFATQKRVKLGEAWVKVGATIAAVLGWSMVSSRIHVQGVETQSTPSATLLYYVSRPFEFLDLLVRTLTDQATARFYVESAIGNLGWLDTPFSSNQYALMGILMLAILALTVSPTTFQVNWKNSRLFLTVATAMVVLIEVSLLAIWTPIPATLIVGVQGRYFHIPLLVASLAVLGWKSTFNVETLRARVALGGTILLCLASFGFTIIRLVERYYLVAQY
jgi:uncharacterized membrane protein